MTTVTWEGLYAPTVSGFVGHSSGHKAPPNSQAVRLGARVDFGAQPDRLGVA